MSARESAAEDHVARSDFVRQTVHLPLQSEAVASSAMTQPPRRIIQFWDDLDRLPSDVRECIGSWTELERRGFDLLLFDDRRAGAFITERLGPRYGEAYERCYHPAMRSDYFRLCYILLEGGLYVDADDVYCERSIESLFSDGRLKVQPLCYDCSTEAMVPPRIFMRPDASSSSWIFYFNNNPLAAGSGHPIIQRALSNATASLERHGASELPEIQSTTGPGNLTKSIFETSLERGQVDDILLVLRDWDDVAKSKWPLNYRNDERNWRLSNQRGCRR